MLHRAVERGDAMATAADGLTLDHAMPSAARLRHCLRHCLRHHQQTRRAADTTRHTTYTADLSSTGLSAQQKLWLLVYSAKPGSRQHEFRTQNTLSSYDGMKHNLVIGVSKCFTRHCSGDWLMAVCCDLLSKLY